MRAIKTIRYTTVHSVWPLVKGMLIFVECHLSQQRIFPFWVKTALTAVQHVKSCTFFLNTITLSITRVHCIELNGCVAKLTPIECWVSILPGSTKYIEQRNTLRYEYVVKLFLLHDCGLHIILLANIICRSTGVTWCGETPQKSVCVPPCLKDDWLKNLTVNKRK